MVRLRLAVLLGVGLVACAASTPRPQRGANPPATDPAPPPEPPPFAQLARFGETRLRHPAPVQSLAFTRDRATLATTTRTEPVVRLWDVATGRLVRAVRVRPADTVTLTLVGFSADDRKLLAVRHHGGSEHDPGTEREWGIVEVLSGEFTRCGGLEYGMVPIAISPDGTTIGGFHRSEELALWDFGTGTRLRVLGATDTRSCYGANRVAFSPDGTQIAACDGGRAVFVVRTDGRGPARRLAVDYPNGIDGVFWPQPDRIVAMHSESLRALDPATGRQLGFVQHGGNIRGNPQSAGGGTLFVKPDNDADVVALDLGTLARVPDRTFLGSWRDEAFAASPDGKLLALACGYAVRLFDAATGKSLHTDLDRYPADPADQLHTSADGRRLLSSGGRTAQTWDVPNGRLLAGFSSGQGARWSPLHRGLSPDGRWVIGCYSDDFRSVVRDAETGDIRGEQTKDAGRRPTGLGGPGRVWVWDYSAAEFVADPLPGGEPGPKVRVPAATTFVAASPDGRWLASSGREALRIRDTHANAGWVELESYRERPPRECGLSPPSCSTPVRFSPDGRFLLTWENGFTLWDISGRPFRAGRLTAGPWREWWWQDAAFSHDGRRVAVVSEQGRASHVRVWETASGTEAFRFDPPGGATGCAFTPDGTRLIVAHPDTTFSVWDYPALEARGVRAAGDDWQRLASRDATAGLGAVDALVTDPSAVALLRERFRPADVDRVARLVAELDDDDFATREAASKGLADLGGRAEKALFDAVTKSPSPEVRSRAGPLLRAITEPQSGARLRAGRAVEVLERVGTPAAKELLTEWAKEVRGTVLAAEAVVALKRKP